MLYDFILFCVVCAGSTTSSSTLQNETELGDDDVFTVRIALCFSLTVSLLASHCLGLRFSLTSSRPLYIASLI